MPNISCCCPKRLACTSKINRWHMHHRQNSLIHSNRLVEVKQQRRNWKHTSAFWLKRAYMWHVKLDGDGQCDCCSQAYLSQDYKGLSASESFRQSELSTKAKMHEWGEDTVSGGRIPDVGAEWKTRTEGKCRMWGPYKNCVHGEKEEKNPTKNPHLLRYYYLNIK